MLGLFNERPLVDVACLRMHKKKEFWASLHAQNYLISWTVGTTAAVAQLIENRPRYPNVVGSVPAGGKLSFSPLYILHTYIITTTVQLKQYK